MTSSRIESALTPMGSLCLALVLASALPAGAAQDEHDHDAGDEAHGAVVLTEEEQREFGVETTVAGSGTIHQVLHFPGEIHPNDDLLAHLVPRYDGIVTEVRAALGDPVSKGQTLAVIESDQTLAPYPLKTLIDGIVISKHITLGEAASRDRAPFVVADLGTVWLEIGIYQRDLNRIRAGQKVEVRGSGAASSGHGTIDYLAPVVDENTRTANARVVLDNSAGNWLPGMFVTALVEVDRFEVPVVVPASALFHLHTEEIVFVRDEHGFEIRPVTVGRRGAVNVEIAAGLEAGTTYVNRGGFTLKAELEKASFGDGHNH